MSSRNTSSQGFTLIELIVTVTIAGILMAIAIPSFISTINTNHTNELGMALSLVCGAISSLRVGQFLLTPRAVTS